MSADARGSAGGARARALSDPGASAVRAAADRREVEQILERAVFMAADASRRTLPRSVVASLASSPAASPQLALYVTQRVTDICRESLAAGRRANPVALCIAGFGAQRGAPGRPWEIPTLWIERVWEQRKAEMAARDALQRRVDALRAAQSAASSAVGAARSATE